MLQRKLEAEDEAEVARIAALDNALIERERAADAEAARIAALDAELVERERANEYLRAQQRSRLESDKMLKERLLEFYQSSATQVLRASLDYS